MIENGWTCPFTNGPGGTQISNCVPICGDGLVVAGEVCDDGNNSDGLGCLADCSGSIDGFACTGGDLTTATICT